LLPFPSGQFFPWFPPEISRNRFLTTLMTKDLTANGNVNILKHRLNEQNGGPAVARIAHQNLEKPDSIMRRLAWIAPGVRGPLYT
jgi:hypothetical protein